MNTNIKMVLAAAIIFLSGSAFADDASDISKVNAYVILPSLVLTLHDPGVSEGPALSNETICKLAKNAGEGLASLGKKYSDTEISQFEAFDLVEREDSDSDGLTAKDIKALRSEIAAKNKECAMKNFVQ
jgi:hypothetical protein